MSEREAAVKLTLKGDGFRRGMSDAEKDGKKAARSIGDTFKSTMAEAGRSTVDSLKTSFSKIKDIAVGFVGIAGGLGIAELARKAVTTEGAFRKMAFAIKSGTGEIVNWRDLQKEAQATALKFGHSTEEVAKSMTELRDVTGDTSFARNASKTVAEVATGSHESLETMTKLAAGLNEKFGITDKQMGDTLASVVSLGNAGGVTVEDLGEKINLMGAGAKEAGLSGQAGFQTMVEWMHVAHEATGNLKKGISGVSGIIDALATGALQQPLLAHLQYDLNAAKKSGKDFNAIMGDILQKTGGKQERLAQLFTGDQLKVVSELGKSYRGAFEGTSGDLKAKTAAGIAAYSNALHAVSKGGTSLAEIQEEAAKEMETPEKRIATALEKLEQAIAQPSVMNAFQKLADFMPKLVDQITSHPLLTGAVVAGIPQAIAGAVLKGLTSGLLGGGGGGGAGGGGGVGPGGQAALIGAAAFASYEGGKYLIDKHFEDNAAQESRNFSGETGARNALSAVKTSQTASDRAAVRATIRQQLSQLQNNAADIEYGSIGGARMDTVTRLGAQQRKEAGTAFSGTDDDLRSLTKQISTLKDALAYGGATDSEKSKLLSGQSLSAGELSDVFGSEGGAMPFGGLMQKGSGGDRHRHANVHYDFGATGDDIAAANAAYAKSQQAPQADNSAQARALADAIGSRELKVRIMNPDEVGKSSGPDKPVPGFFPR